GSAPIFFAFSSSPLARVTLISCASLTTWLLVMMYPSRVYMTPDPVPFSGWPRENGLDGAAVLTLMFTTEGVTIVATAVTSDTSCFPLALDLFDGVFTTLVVVTLSLPR